MAQQQSKHPAQRAAERTLKWFPETVRWAQQTYMGKRDWDAGCLIPEAPVINKAIEADGLETDGAHAELMALPTILAWQLSQGIYRFDPDLYREITTTVLDDSLHIEAFKTLPEWALYIETPEFPSALDGEKPDGFFVSLSDESSVPGYGLELRLVFVLKRGQRLLTLPLPLAGNSISDCLAALEMSARNNLRHLNKMDFASLLTTHLARSLRTEGRLENAQDVAYCLTLLLYLCSEEPDTAAPRRHELPKRDRRGQVIPTPLRPKAWDVGLRFGVKIRAWQQRQQAKQHQEGSTGESGAGIAKRPHVRRAHYHGYWYGPKKDGAPQKYKVRWLSPILVGDIDGVELPAVVHPVER